MKAEVSSLVFKLRSAFSVQLIQIPKGIRSMPFSTFMREFGGDVAAVQQRGLSEKMARLAELAAPPPSTVRRANKRRAAAAAAATGAAAAKAPRTASKRARTSGKTAKAAEADSPPRTVRRSARLSVAPPMEEAEAPPATAGRRSSRRSTAVKAAEPKRSALSAVNGTVPRTPAGASKKSAVGRTPAMDARLPKTPFLRAAKRGESFISLNGSPIAAGPPGVHLASSASTITLPLDDGKIMQLPATVDDLGPATKGLSKRNKRAARDKLAALQDQLTAMMAALA